MLAITVDTNLDIVDAGDSLTSLREAITTANGTAGADTIDFDAAVYATPQTIAIGGQLPTITDALTITGPGAALLTIDAGNGTDNAFATGDGFRHFYIYDGEFGAQITVAISGLTLTGGDVTGFGGGAISNREDLTLTDSTLSDNSSRFFGGGVYNWPLGTATITASTLSGNSAARSGGGVSNFGTATITASTLSGNSANDSGGGVYNLTSGTATITGSLIANSVSGGDLYGSWLEGSFNLIEDGSQLASFTDSITGTPLLGPLADNGGPTLTHALLPGSLAINAGDPAFDPNGFDPPLLTDQRGDGFNRVKQGRIDIGAYEAQGPVTAAPGDYNRDGVVNAADYTVWRDTLDPLTPVAPLTGADGDGDGFVTAEDYGVWASQYGFTYTLPAAGLLTVAASTPPMAVSAHSPPATEPVLVETVDRRLDTVIAPLSTSPPSDTTRARRALDPAPRAALRRDDLLLLALGTLDAAQVKHDELGTASDPPEEGQEAGIDEAFATLDSEPSGF